MYITMSGLRNISMKSKIITISTIQIPDFISDGLQSFGDCGRLVCELGNPEIVCMCCAHVCGFAKGQPVPFTGVGFAL